MFSKTSEFLKKIFIWLGQIIAVAPGIFIAPRGAFHCVGLSTCGTWAQWWLCSGLVAPAACGILGPWPRIEPVSPALQGRLLTTGPPGKSRNFWTFYWKIIEAIVMPIALKECCYFCWLTLWLLNFLFCYLILMQIHQGIWNFMKFIAQGMSRLCWLWLATVMECRSGASL